MSSGNAVRLALSVPPNAEQISTIRSFAFAAGRHGGLDEEAIEDLKLALSEIAAEGVERGGATPLVIEVLLGRDLLEVSVDASPGQGSSSPVRIDRQQLVRALFPTVRVVDSTSGVRTTFSVARG
jgi:anti-sigma regulatory factor (Ser/Thr protein kinase)